MVNIDNVRKMQEDMRTFGRLPTFAPNYAEQWATDQQETDLSPEASSNDNSWGVTRGLLSGGAGVLQGQAQLANLAGIGDGATADYFGKIMQKNARKKEYTIGDMLPFASDYWTNGEGAAYDIGNMLGSSVVLGGETAAAMATGGAALGALGVGSEAAAAAAALGRSATAARAAFMTDAVVNGMGRAAAKMGMPKLQAVLTGPMGKLYAANILKTPLEASSEAGNAGAEALANGASLSDAQRQALIVGGLQMPLLALSNTIESAGLGGLFLKEAEQAAGKKVGKEELLAILGNITREGMQNAWEEGMQQSTHEYAAGKQNLLGVVNPFQWSEEAAQQAAVGAVGGAVIGGGNAGMRGYATREKTAPESTPVQEAATMTPAQQAREYLDTIGQQEDKFSPEQIATLRDVAENADDAAVMDVAAQFGWQAPEAQQQTQGQEQQAQPAPVTPASTPEEQIQTATNAVNAETAAVVNGGEVSNNGGEQGAETPAQQSVQAQQPVQTSSPVQQQQPTQAAMPVVQSISGGSRTNYPTIQVPSFGVAENPLGQDKVNVWLGSLRRTMNDKLSKGNKTRKYLNNDGSINIRTLRAAPALRRWLDETPAAVSNLKAALNGNQDAMKWVSKLSPTRQAAAFDALENGLEDWKVTDEDRQNFAKYDYYQGVKKIKSQLYDKAKNLKGNERIALYSLLKKGSNDKILSAAKKYGIAVPKEVSEYKPNSVASSGTNNINSIIENILNGNSTNISEPVETGVATPNSDIVETATPDNVEATASPTASAQPANTVTSGNNGGKVENKKLPAITFAGIKTIPRVSSDGKYLGFKLPTGATLSREELDDFKAAGFAYNDNLKANIAEDTEKARAFLAKYAAEKDINSNTNGGGDNATNTNGPGENGSDKGSENPVQGQQPKEPVENQPSDNQGQGENGEVEVTTPAQPNADANGITVIPYDADQATVEKLQKANTKIIMDKVNSIDKQYDDGKLSADEARKAISEFFQKYSQSKATHKVYEDGTKDKVSAIRKNITKKADAARRNAKKAEAEAANKAKKEAEEKRKKAYEEDFKKASEEADEVLEQHKNEEISLSEADSKLDGITEALEQKLEARGDKLKVKDKEQLYTRRQNQLKRQQEELDKKIIESLATQGMADSQKKLNEDGLKVFAWAKKELSDDPRKRFNEKSIDAAAAIIGLRAQTWTKLFNKYCGTNYTPLEYAQRYPFYFYDDVIPGETEGTLGLTTQSKRANTGNTKIEFSGRANDTSLFHELGHAFWADFVHVAESPNAPEHLKDDLRTLREWIGEVEPENKDLDTPYFYSKQQESEYSGEERFGNAMVKHIVAADTPIEWLNNMFKEFTKEIVKYIKDWEQRIKNALGSPEKTERTERYARAYTFDFEIPADVKRIINEMIYYDENAHKEVTYDTQFEDLEAINKEVISTFNEDTIPSPKVINDFKRRIAAAGRWKKEYTDEQKAVLEAAAKVATKNLELAAWEQNARLAFDKVDNGDKSESTLINATSGLLDGVPDELEKMPDNALTVLENALTDQQIEDIRDFGREKLAQAVLSDYAVSGKLDDDFNAFYDDLQEDGIEESTLKAVKKYAGLILDSVKKYQSLYEKRKALEQAQKALEQAQAALRLKNLVKQGNATASKKKMAVGERAKTANVQKLEAAEQMEREGKTREEIFDATGWWRGKDDKWRFEIKDDPKKVDAIPLLKDGKAKLWSIYDNKELFEAYPWLKDIDIIVEEDTGEYLGYTNAKDKKIVLTDALLSDAKSFQEEMREYIKESVQTNLKESKAKFSSQYWLNKNQAPKFAGRMIDKLFYYNSLQAVENDIESLAEVLPNSYLKYYLSNKQPKIKATRNMLQDLLEINNNMLDDMKGTLFHEIQHLIQAHEGFAYGGNENYTRKILEQEKIRLAKEITNPTRIRELKNTSDKLERLLDRFEKKSDFENYMDLYNEQEARATKVRAMGHGYEAYGEQYAHHDSKKYPWEDFDNEDDAIVMFADGNVSQYSARPGKDKDFTISSINLKYKKELEQAFERNANAGDITAIQNRHQEELAQYLKDKGEKQKEKAKLRAAELRELRKKLKAGEIDSFEMAGGRVTLDKDGKEKFESIQDPNELPSFVYKNNQHNDEAYNNATATQKLNASIKRPEEKGTIQTAKDWLKDAKDKFYKQWVDKYDALGILDKAIAKKGGKPANDSMTILSQMQMVTNYATGAARALVEGDENSLKPLVKKWGIKGNTSLNMIMEKLESDHKSGKYKDYIKNSSLNGKTGAQDYVNALENYLTALTLWESAQNHKLDYDREVAEWQKKGARGEKPKETPYKFPNNLTEDDIKQIIRSAPAEFKGYQKMFKSVTDDLLNIMLKSGLITLDRYDTLRDRYKFYCPLYRDFSDTAAVDDLVTQINAGKGLGNVSDPLKSRSSEGSFRDVSAPLTNAVKSISAICAKAERNRVGQYAVGQAKKHKLDEFIHEVKGNAGDAKNCIFTVMFNGEKHAYQTTPELYPAITAAVEPLCKIQMAVLTKPAQLLRYGSTMSPSFIIRNFLRDTIFAAVSSKNGFIPIYDSLRGGYAYVKNKQLRGEYEAAGVASSNYYSDAEAVTKSLNEMAGGKTWQEMTPMDIAKAFVKKPVAGLEWLSELIENSTRMGEFMRARAKGKSIEQAGHDAVEVSLNFNRSGATGQQINRMVPFFNACIQGGDKMYRLFKANPRHTSLQIAKYIVLPSLVLWALNHDEDWYKDIDPNIKMTNWIIGGLRIPKPQEAGILFGSGLEAMLDTANGQDPKAMKEWRHNVIEALTPGFLPTVILPIIEWMANYSFFRDKPVVSQALQRLPDEMQYGPYTSETAKGIGSITGLSPVKIDNLWRGYTGTMGMFLFQAPDLFAAEKQNLPEKKVSEMVVARDFIINDMNMNRTMNEFYQLKEAATQKHAGYGKKGKPSAEVAGVNIAAQSIQKLQNEAREITASSKYNSAQKRVLIDKLQAKQKKIAQTCIKKYGDKFDY